MMLLLSLFASFAKIGLLAVGGGLATLPFLYELANTHDWISIADISNLVAISESTPGPLGVNMATYVGFIRAGVPGAVTATIGLITPSIILIIIIAGFLRKFQTSTIVKNVFYGLRAASCALITAAMLGVAKLAFFGAEMKTFFWQGALLAVVLFFATRKLRWHPVVFIAISAVVGIIFKFSI